jgi:Fur family transcriptional regulator, ferric uptake regulator
MAREGPTYRPVDGDPDAPQGHRLNDQMLALLGDPLTPAEVLDPPSGTSTTSSSTPRNPRAVPTGQPVEHQRRPRVFLRLVAGAHGYTATMGSSVTTAAELLRAQGLRMTPQRLAIVQQIMGTAGYVVPMEVVARVQAKVPGVSAATVYRTLERLEHLGLLTHVHLESGVGYHRVDDVQHAHLTCAGCGGELELSERSLRDLERVVERDHGFRADFTHHAISGLCTDCQSAEGAAGR